MGTFSIWHWLIVLVVVVLVFGTKKLRSIGGDLGGALKSFRKAMDSDDKDSEDEPERLEQGTPDAEFTEQKDKSESS